MSGRDWDRKRCEELKATMSNEDIAALRARSQRDPQSLSIEEIGVLFLVTRERIRAIEAKAKSGRGNNHDQ